jgi:hypothetical protein
MSTLLEIALNLIKSTFSTILTWLNGVNMNIVIWLLVVFVVLLSLLVWRKLKPSYSQKKPELLISKGEIVQVESSTIQVLHLKVSNLNEYAVQLLEFSIKTNLMATPITVEAVELLGPHESVEFEANMPVSLVGEKGDVKLYAYIAQPFKKMFLLRSTFAWEPWNRRHKISALGQTLRPVRRLGSTQLERLRKRAWIDQYAPKANDFVVARDIPELKPEARPATQHPQAQSPERKRSTTNDLDFPNEF